MAFDTVHTIDRSWPQDTTNRSGAARIGDAAPKDLRIEIELCVPEDQEQHLPERRRAPHWLPSEAPLPRQGDVIYMSSTSAWGVELVIHEWRSPVDLRIEVWITHVGCSRHRRLPGFALTQ